MSTNWSLMNSSLLRATSTVNQLSLCQHRIWTIQFGQRRADLSSESLLRGLRCMWEPKPRLWMCSLTQRCRRALGLPQRQAASSRTPLSSTEQAGSQTSTSTLIRFARATGMFSVNRNHSTRRLWRWAPAGSPRRQSSSTKRISERSN